MKVENFSLGNTGITALFSNSEQNTDLSFCFVLLSVCSVLFSIFHRNVESQNSCSWNGPL